MSYKTILVPLCGTEGDPASLSAACRIATTFQAHIDAVFAQVPASEAVPMVGEGVSGAVLDQLIAAAEGERQERQDKARAKFGEIVGKLGVKQHDTPPGPGEATAAFKAVPGREDEVMVQASHLCDLVVLSNGGRSESEDPQFTITMEALLISGSRPLLLAPAAEPASIGQRVAIAWNGSAQGARAVAGALPFLYRAEEVTVLTAATGRTEAGVAQELVDYLAWHGIDATTKTLDAAGGAVGGALLAAAAEAGSDLLVMGGYSHSRLRELILGGVTRHVLAEAALPVLMSH